MGGKPSDIAGATQAGGQGAGGGRASGDTAGTPPRSLGGGEVTRIPSAEPPTDAPPGSQEPQPVPGGGWWCYSAPARRMVSSPYGPLPAAQFEAAAWARCGSGRAGRPMTRCRRDPGRGPGKSPAQAREPVAWGEAESWHVRQTGCMTASRWGLALRASDVMSGCAQDCKALWRHIPCESRKTGRLSLAVARGPALQTRTRNE